MMLWHDIMRFYHAKRALRYALLSRSHVEKGEAHMRRAREIEGRTA
jgi:hypothetical protein